MRSGRAGRAAIVCALALAGNAAVAQAPTAGGVELALGGCLTWADEGFGVASAFDGNPQYAEDTDFFGNPFYDHTAMDLSITIRAYPAGGGECAIGLPGPDVDLQIQNVLASGMDELVAAGRATRVEAMSYVICDDVPGYFAAGPAAGRFFAVFTFGTDRIRDEAEAVCDA